ncbi:MULTISPECIES: hypothetical protein [unclassified Candidatus Frackibacter]|nr:MULTISPECIES: hypothetical protein [unclassified Candidatus Frackibacter]KXS40396.1 MAG: hypothetical protein AWU54_1990 [Candidatus Frackibacter sp. T328-2]SDC37657.1 hypothetical protein SAMN04515661_10850 [Candidatus Frackibacter sp. WG11]SEM62517.1 hypothetical protein SAMN04488698_10939 [Candidatus Frackibacter sp. WG12]SFL65327.1 hypothetical protein SAMN04488699_10851 [Candidatus Frackibacter sp. WG13]
MSQKDVKFTDLNEHELQKLNKMERALGDRKGKKVILLAYEME